MFCMLCKIYIELSQAFPNGTLQNISATLEKLPVLAVYFAFSFFQFINYYCIPSHFSSQYKCLLSVFPSTLNAMRRFLSNSSRLMWPSRNGEQLMWAVHSPLVMTGLGFGRLARFVPVPVPTPACFALVFFFQVR